MTTATAEVTDEEIAKRLTSPEVSNRSVAQELGVSWGRVDLVRQQLGIETYQRGRRVPEATWEEAVVRRVKDVDDGHAEWTGGRNPTGVPVLSWRGIAETAYRAVFRMHHERDPEGNITHTCDRGHCVAGGHLADRVLRAERRAGGDGGA